MAKAKRKAVQRRAVSGALKAPAASAFYVGARVRVVSGDYGNSEGTVESVAGNKVTVHVHGRLTVTTTADNLALWSGSALCAL